MKAKLFLSDKTIHDIDFTDCNTLEGIRKWLNRSAPFITNGENEIINTGQICNLEPFDSTREEK